jgi:hypothetical protein
VRPLKAATEPMVTMRPWPLHHLLRHRLAGQNGAEQVAIQHRAHVFFLDRNRIVRIRLAAFGGDVAAGIVDENIDRAEFSARRLDHAGDVGPQREIAEHADGPHAMGCCDFFRYRRQRRSLAIFRRPVLAHAVDCDVGAHACEFFGESAAEPAACARDQCDLALESPRAVL